MCSWQSPARKVLIESCVDRCPVLMTVFERGKPFRELSLRPLTTQAAEILCLCFLVSVTRCVELETDKTDVFFGVRVPWINSFN